MNWHNVSKKEPCPICHKTDWCNLSNDGAVCICHRVESPHLARSGSGWIHRLIDRPPSYSSRKSYSSRQPSTTLDFEKVHHSYDNDPTLIEGLATTLGVDDLALKSLDVRFNRFDECWSFPMRNAEGDIIGLRFRELAGSRKWSARGSHDGLFFIPNQEQATTNHELIIVEGASDAAAAISLFHHILQPSTFTLQPAMIAGRSSCQTGSCHIRQYIRRVGAHIVTIVADNDEPGIRGAKVLASQLITNHQSLITQGSHFPVRILIVPHPYKDIRAWYLSGQLTPKAFKDMASAQKWQ